MGASLSLAVFAALVAAITVVASMTVIGAGGIDSPETAQEKIKAGASVLQLYSGLVFKGPGLVPDIIEGLAKGIENS